MGGVEFEPKTLRERIVCRAPLVLLTSAHQVFLSTLVLITCIPMVFGVIRPDTIHSQVAHWQAECWAWTLLAGSVLTLIGSCTYRPHIERVGVVWQGVPTLFYSAAILTGPGFKTGGLSAAIFFGYATLCFWRAFKISSSSEIQQRLLRDRRRLHRELEEHLHEGGAD